MADSTTYDPYAPPEQSTGKKLTRNVVLPVLAVLETILTAKASKGNFVGRTGIDMLNRFDDQDKSQEESRLKAVDRMLSSRRADAQDSRAAASEKRAANQFQLEQDKNEEEASRKGRAENLSLAREDRIRDAVSRLLGSPEGQKLTPSQREFANVNPSDALKFLAFPDLAKDPVQTPAGPRLPIPRLVPAGVTTDLADTKNSITQLQNLEASSDSLKTDAGPLNRLRGLNPWDTEAQGFQQLIASTKQVIGKGLEGGVLRAEDEKKYEKIIPKMGDTPEVRKEKFGQLRTLLENKYNSQLAELKGVGYHTGTLDSIARREPPPPAPKPPPPPRPAPATPPPVPKPAPAQASPAAGKPAVGTVKTNNIGMKVRWNGSRWERAQ